MTDLQIIESSLERLARRRRWLRAWRGFWIGLLAGSAAWLILVVAYKLLPFSAQFLTCAAFLFFLLVGTGLVWGIWRKNSLAETARWVEARFNLQQRLSTSLELARTSMPEEWRKLLVADAVRYAGRLTPGQIIPFGLPNISRWVLLVLVISAGLGFVPEYRSPTFRQRQAEKAILREAGQHLVELTRRNLSAAKPALAATRESLAAVDHLGEKMLEARLTRSEALRELTRVNETLKQEAKQLSQTPTLKRLEQAARMSANSPNGKVASALKKQIDELQKQLGQQAASPEALGQLRKELEKAREAAAGMASKDTAGDSNAREQLDKSMAALSQKARDLGVSLPGLEEAIEALSADKTALMVRDLNTALQDLDKLQAMAQALQQMQQQAERLGKDLAEQLENGQAQAAETTLRKMAELLKTANLDPAQARKISDEVARAAAPAADYGKVADLLKKATGQMTKSEQAAAAESLSAAADELAKLSAEMNDVESLKATLAALQRAQECVATGDNWGNGRSNRIAGGRGRAKGNRGFGTWAEEEGWLQNPEYSDLWENPPENRGVMDPRSNLDRGEGKLADNLDPTKIRGSMSPGGSMPSITLKGVSIKGLSTVAYQEAAMAAQSEAQNALSQEQIPRAYQGAVKDYFDDLKK